MYKTKVHVDSAYIKHYTISASTSSSRGKVFFPFKLPKDGLALRSASVENGVPQLHFGASPKVPAILEGDVATIFKLVSENKRPEFFYGPFPPTHPMHGCRYFMQYSPDWLRWTSVGKLLAEADWNMKSLHVGLRSNEQKTVYKSWSAESELRGLASHLDFPIDGLGPIMMSCDHVRVQKGVDEVIFPEEPKMKITDHSSSLYSKYITAIYPSVAYHDEPMLLKMQELIKLIVVVEWLYKEKGVRADQEWVMGHTSKKPTSPSRRNHTSRLVDKDNACIFGPRSKPPNAMIPKLTEFKCPSKDVFVNTLEAQLYQYLEKKYSVERRYGYLDFTRMELIMFTKDGTPCPPQKCLRIDIKLCPSPHSILSLHSSTTLFPLRLGQERPSRGDLLELLQPEASDQEIAIDDFSGEQGIQMRLKITSPDHGNSTVVMATSNFDYASKNPNMPTLQGFPNVKNWDELISELSVPIPRIQQAPFVGLGEPMAFGGVTTRNFDLRVEPVSAKLAESVPVKAEPVPLPVRPVRPVRAEPVPVRAEPVPVRPVRAEPVPVRPVRTEPVPVRPVRTEPVPVRTDPVPARPAKSVPVKAEPVPLPVRSPVRAKPVPVRTEPVPVRIEPVPVRAKPVPVRTEPVPVRTEPVPVRTEPVPVRAEPVPVRTEPVPVRAEPVPVRAEPVPVRTEPVPVRPAESVPVKAEPVPLPVRSPVRAEPVPVRAEPVPVRAEPVPVRELVPVGVEQPVPVRTECISEPVLVTMEPAAVWEDPVGGKDQDSGGRPKKIRSHGTIRIAREGEFKHVSEKFFQRWEGETRPSFNSMKIFALSNPRLEEYWRAYRNKLTLKKSKDYYHGAHLACDIATSFCTDGNCGICGISNEGFDKDCIRRNMYFVGRFGPAFYLAPNSSRSHEHATAAADNEYKAMLLCDVLEGNKYELDTSNQGLTAPPTGYDSVYGIIGKDLKSPEIALYDPHAIMPRYIIFYKMDK